MKSYLVLTILVGILMVSCSRKSSNDDAARMDSRATAADGTKSNESSSPEPEQQQKLENSGVPLPAGASSSPARAQPKNPSFYDQRTGQIKDLPTYPNSSVINMQLGPLQESDTAMFVLRTSDPLNKVSDFYIRAAKSNGWEVADELNEPDIFKLQLRKGTQHEGLVQAKRQEQYGFTDIAISRIERPPQPKE
jgi:hypothetical protein